MSRRSQHRTPRQYPRTARLNELLREILAEELERMDDDRLQMVTVTSVDIEGDLGRAKVFFDSLQGEDGDDEVLEALGEVRWKLQGAIGRQARMKRTPELVFAPDPAVRAGARIDELLAEMPPPTAGDDEVEEAGDGVPGETGSAGGADEGLDGGEPTSP